MAWSGRMRGVWAGAIGLALWSFAAAEEGARPNDTGRLYFQVVSGIGFTYDTPFAGDVDIDGEPDLQLGGSLGYNIDRNWGIELQFQGGEPDLRSASRGKIREISIITVVPAARYRWHLLDDRLVPYVTGGVGMSFTDVNEDAKPFTKADTSSSTVVGSISAGFDYFLNENVAVGLESRYFIHPNQDAWVSFQDGPGGRVTRSDGSLNLSGISLLAQLRVYPGQQAGPGQDRRFFLADHGPFDTGELRFYLAGLVGYDFLFDRGAGGGVKLRDEGGDFNLTKGGAIGVNLDAHWGAEVQILATPLNLRYGDLGKIAEVNTTAFLPTLRWRWPLLDGRLVPYLTAGLGVAYQAVNDPRVAVEVPSGSGARTVFPPKWQSDRTRMVGSVGAGAEYFLNRHISAGLYVPVHMYQRADTQVRFPDGRTVNGTVDFSGVMVLLQLKAYLPW